VPATRSCVILLRMATAESLMDRHQMHFEDDDSMKMTEQCEAEDNRTVNSRKKKV